MTRIEGEVALREAGVPDPRRDARILWEHCATSGDDFAAAIARRVDRQPVSQIIGRRAFWKHEFTVTGDVLDPRPETETLVELALAETFTRVLDMGTGSGCILISLLAERPTSKGVGIDISEKGILVAGENAKRLGVSDRITLPLSEWWDDVGGRYDLIVSNPPYIAIDEMASLSPEVKNWEPREALTDEGDGLSAYRKIAPGAVRHLLPGGRLLVEIGPAQGAAVAAIFKESGLKDVRVHQDLDGRDRVVCGKMP